MMKDIKNMSYDELNQELKKQRRALFELEFQMRTNPTHIEELMLEKDKIRRKISSVQKSLILLHNHM